MMRKREGSKEPDTKLYNHIVGYVVKNVPNVAAIVLVGSRARMEDKKFSDVDILVVSGGIEFNKKKVITYMNRLIQIDILGVQFLEEISSKKSSHFRLYVEANKLSSMKLLYSKSGKVEKLLKKIVKHGKDIDVLGDNVSNLYSHILERKGKILNAMIDKNRKNVIFSSRILGEYSALLVIAYNSEFAGAEHDFFDYVKGMRYKPTGFDRLFESCMWSTVSEYRNTADSALELADNITAMLLKNPAKMRYPKELNIIIGANNKLYGNQQNGAERGKQAKNTPASPRHKG
jgi:predicted nucleotidyltransferase